MPRRRVLVWTASLTLASSVMGGTAFAEGNFLSSISGAFTGFESRQWTDHNSDNVGSVIRFRGCTRAGGFGTNTAVNLRRTISGWPDDNKGTKTLYCAVVDEGNWGDVQSGTYRFRIDRINGATSGYQLWVDSLRVIY
jgi:hypothetical protein